LSFVELVKENMMYSNFLMCPTAMSKTEIYKNKIKVWNGHDFKSAADVDVWFRFAKLQNVGIISKELINYRISLNSFSYRRLKSRVTPLDYFIVMDYYVSIFDDTSILTKDDYDSYKFLKFKDCSVIERNCILNGIITDNVIHADLSILKQALKSRVRFLHYCIAIAMKILNYKKLISR
jgi:hypothetical protein